ncbi:MAG TPA: hypothetical protein VEA37_05320 [Flavobacterium sp.]|nr:hypothetical protein [Flavobacterium sp.]
MNRKKKIVEEARKILEEAKQNDYPIVRIELKPGQTSSLGVVINSKKKADLFMAMLELVTPKSASS